MAESKLLQLTAAIISAYCENNRASPVELTGLVSTVHAALLGTGQSASTEEVLEPRRKRAVSVSKSVTADRLICLFDGAPYKMLKHHLRAAHGMTPQQYRAHWSLPADYPMVSETSASLRSGFAKSIGLGRKRAGAAGRSPTPVLSPAVNPTTQTRAKAGPGATVPLAKADPAKAAKPLPPLDTTRR
jgi:predicted transcriptional regulator